MKKIKSIGRVARIRCEKYIKNVSENREEIRSLETAKRRREDNTKIDLGETIRSMGTGSFGCGYWWALLNAETNTSVKLKDCNLLTK